MKVLKGASVSVYTIVCHISRAKLFFYRKNIHTFTELVGQEHCNRAFRWWIRKKNKKAERQIKWLTMLIYHI